MQSTVSSVSAAHAFVAANPNANLRLSSDLTRDELEKELYFGLKEGESVDESCYPVLVLEGAEGPFTWADVERGVGFTTR